jgi:acyl dehydratase
VRYLEDYEPGSVHEYDETVSVSAEEIVEFARAYDPQPFHVDEEAARESPYGGLIASGWQTAALSTRLMVKHYFPPEGSLGSPGIDELRWPQPLRPDVPVRLRVTVRSTRPSSSKPDRGILASRIELVDADGAPVFSCECVNLMRRRPAP